MLENLTYEGAKAQEMSVQDQLRRSVLSCLLWDNTFYESGESIENRISKLSGECDPKVVAALAIEARGKYKLRSVPLLLARELAKKGGSLVSTTLEKIIQRPDEITKFMQMYWKDGRTPISKQVKKGLAKAFGKFNEYQFAKWNNNDKIDLRDIMFMVHPKPENTEQASLFQKLADRTMEIPVTWEVGLSKTSTPEQKKSVWEGLLRMNKLGALALLKNLRGMTSVGVDRELIKNALRNIKTDRVLPYRFVTAAKHNKTFQEYLEGAMYRCLKDREKIEGKTILLVDVSGSMDDVIGNAKYTRNWTNVRETIETTRLDTAIGLAILLKYLCKDVSIYTFSNDVVKVDTEFGGFKLGEKIDKSQSHCGTELGKAIRGIVRKEKDFDRIIVITDEQSHDDITDKIPSRGYIMNVAPYQNGIDHDEKWVRINGFSEAVIDWMIEYEKPIIGWDKNLDEMFTITWSEV